VTLTYHDADVLARTIWGEARGEPWDGKIAVAAVMLNRWRSGRWFAAPTLAGTCQKPGQFSCWLDNDPNKAKLLAVTLADASLQECWSAGLTAVNGPLPFAQNVWHYLVTGTPAGWATGQAPIATIGHHSFYAGIA
jgi:N-acetylmuramoyl-L-alanine amidase